MDTIAEAIKALGQQVKALRPIPGQARPVYDVVCDGVVTVEDLFKVTDHDIREVHLVPAMCGGGGKGGVFAAIGIGILLIAVAWWNPAALVGLAALLPAGVSATGMLFSLGLSLVLGGILQLMSAPTPNAEGTTVASSDTTDPATSRYLGSPKNTTKIGTRVNIFFGENKVPGHFLSFNIDTSEGIDTPYTNTSVGTIPDSPDDGSMHTQPSAVYPKPAS